MDKLGQNSPQMLMVIGWMSYNGEMFIAVGRSWNDSYSKYVNTITTSIDGETWTPTEIVKDENGGIITTVPSGIIAVPAK